MVRMNYKHKDPVENRTHLVKKAAVVLIILLLIPTLLVVFKLSCVHAEPDEHVNCWHGTNYRCETDSDALSYNARLNAQRFTRSECFNFESKPLEGLELTFTTDLPGSFAQSPQPVAHSDSTYQWAFPDVPPDASVGVWMGFDPSVVPSSFTPDFSASRILSTNKIEYPGGRQTVTLSVTPQKTEYSEIQAFYHQIGLSVWTTEDEDIEPSIVSVTWPSASGNEKPPPGCSVINHNQDNHTAQCTVTEPDTNFTYTLVVTIDLKLKDGIREVEYKPSCVVVETFSGQNMNVNGTSVTFSTESGTWKWELPSEHTWQIQAIDNIEEEVHFLPRAILTLGYKVMIHDMPPGADFQTWIDPGGIFSSDDIPYSFIKQNATIYYYSTNLTRYRFFGWTADYTSNSFDFSIAVSHLTTIDANWAKEHKVIIQLSKNSALFKEHEGWYDENETLQYQADERMTKDFFYDYVLDHYTVNGAVHMERMISAKVTEPLDVVVYYGNEINIVNVSMVILPLIVIISILIFIWMRKRKTVSSSPERSA